MRMPRARRGLAGLVLLLAVVGSACASSPAPPSPQVTQGAYPQQAAYPPPQPTAGIARADDFAAPPAPDVVGNIAQIDRAELTLTLLLGPENQFSSPPAAEPGVVPTSPAEPPAMPLAQSDSCSIACAALASMRRSAAHVCELTGDADSVCGGARDRVERATRRVTAACPSCSN